MAPISLFVSVYLATFNGGGRLVELAGVPFMQWVAFLSAVVATIVTVWLIDGRRWRIGIAAPPVTAARELLLGGAFAAILIGCCDLLVACTTDLHHGRGTGFPWGELAAVFVPAAAHEELVFRGYLYQKLNGWHRAAGLGFSGGAFALLHLINAGITAIAVLNIAVAGVLLALARDRFDRLWFPFGLHLAWNLTSGPILGWPVSSFVPQRSVFTAVVHGPAWLTGGMFGIEGSVLIVAVEIAAICVMLRWEKT